MKYYSIISFIICFCISTSDVFSQKTQKSAKKSDNLTAKNAGIVAKKDTVQYDSYEGKWFGIKYPKGWSIRPSMKNSYSGADDSVFFIAPDSTAEFYVFCPRYTGKPIDIEIDRSKENQISQRIEEERGVRVRTVQIQAKDSSYVRFIEDTEAFIKFRRLVFGVLFRGDKGRIGAQKYNNSYLYFKQSFRKFTD